MEIKHFRLIKSIAEEGSIASSSEKLFLTQSALSHQLKELEARLGFKVFFRTRNKWKLTNQGSELYKLANELLLKIDASFETIGAINRGSSGKVRIGTECYSFYQGLPVFIQKMGILYPKIEVDIVMDATHNPVPQLISDKIDMAITTERPNNKILESVELFEDELICLMNKECRFNLDEFIDFPSFSDVHLFIHSYPLSSVSIYCNHLKPMGITPKKITAIPFLSLVLEMVAANMGVITLPRHTLRSFNLSDQVAIKAIGEEGLRRKQYLVFRRADQSKQYIRDFIANIRDEFMV